MNRLRKIFCFIFFTCLYFNMLFSQSQRGYLEVKGYVKSGNSFIEAVDVDVFQKGEKVQGILTKQSGHFNFILDLNYDYTVQFSKNGLVTKKVDIITNVPEVETGIWYYKFSIDLFPMIPELDISVLQKPVEIGRASCRERV